MLVLELESTSLAVLKPERGPRDGQEAEGQVHRPQASLSRAHNFLNYDSHRGWVWASRLQGLRGIMMPGESPC